MIWYKRLWLSSSLLVFVVTTHAAQTLAPAGTALNVPHNYTWNRMTTINVSSGQIVPFAAYGFNTFSGTAGTYTISMTTVGFRGTINVYQSFFDPTTPNANFYQNGVVAAAAGTITQNVTIPANSLFVIVFSAANTGNSGTFSASISGPGNVNISTQSTVSIQVGPQSQTIISGSSAALSVYAIGPLPHTWQWYNGLSGDTSNPIAGATSPNYTTPTLIASNNYWVRVTGPAGAGSQNSGTAAINVTGNPNANFSGSLAPGGCTLTNGTLYAVQRFQIQSQGNYIFNITPGFTLTTYEGVFDPLTPQNNLWGVLNGFYSAGTYDLVISKTSPGGAFSGAIGGGPAIVNLVASLPPEFLSSPLDTTISPGKTATLSASMTCGTPFTLQWYRGNSGDTSSPISGATSSSYTTPALTTNASYWVRMNFSGGHTDSGTATVFVTNGPIFDSGILSACDRSFNRPSAPGTLSGSSCFYKTFVFRVSSAGSYTFSLQTTNFGGTMFLYQGGWDPSNPLVNLYNLSTAGPLVANLLAGTTLYYLVISSYASGDTGPYTVTVTAGPAFVTSTAAPVISLQPAGANIFSNHTATLTVASPSSNLAYQWYSGASCGSKSAILGATSNSYTTPPLNAPQNYWVELSNPGGYLFSAEALVAIIPQIVGVTSTAANGAYRAGHILPVIISFDRAVDVTGVPLLALNSGGVATYASGTGTAALILNYTVAAGQNSADLDVLATNSLTLNGGTIKALGVTANLALPAPGAVGSLSAVKNIIIDTTPPTLSISAPSAPTASTGPVTYTVSYVDANFNSSTLSVGDLTLNATGNATATVGVSGAGATRTVTLSGITGNGTLSISIAAGTATDTAGNTALAAGPSPTLTAINPTPPLLIQPALLPNGAFGFAFTNWPGAGFTILGSTNPLSVTDWNVLGAPIENPPGQYQFRDPGASTNSKKFYRVRSP